MHVAVCDDNIADRKQTERLLNRESERRAKITEGLFIDSYGNEKALLSKPMQYDIFYIDMCKIEGITGQQIAQKLYDAGVRVPIYMCCSQVNYRQFDLPENVFFLDKPLKSDALCASLDHAEDIKSHAVSMIELRDNSETHYVTESDILYATQKGNNILVFLSNGQTVSLTTTMDNLFFQWQNFETFFFTNTKNLVNVRHISKIGILRIHMTNGATLPLNPSQKPYISKACALYHS